ncbi:DUF2785 domain-containing protein [Pediococcus acidilactici]|uniref:DUF2785 domain-containing protein n=1 Tax=Pediococcus acidilactici TaxID=1254 RepID=UPI00270051A1|nr:DUF2785 domain-containing protein [Pediococcus acidilactici]MDO7802841.1 DUF2785 domain-containing protein [Pediococcus acidilactici]
MDAIETTRQKLRQLRVRLQQGKIFASLGRSVGAIIDAANENRTVKPVTLPDDQDGIEELLQRIRAALGKGELEELSDADLDLMLQHLGSPNPIIRDKGVFYLFNDLIQNQVLTKSQMVRTFDRLTSDQVLFAHINEKENDAAFLRSFAVMMLASLIYIDRAGAVFIDHARKNKLVEQLAIYIMLENDTRGFVANQGWVHAYTHIGNVLDELASDEELLRADKILLMATVIEKFRRLTTPLIYGEPTRLAVYFADQLLEDDVYQQFLLIELREWRRALASTQVRETQAMRNAIFNRQRLLQAMMLNSNMAKAVVEYLEDSNDFTI